ncbi:MAG: hypothetical protein H7A34_00750 [bacterium]|nr:hypothetical protein [bacterium]
MLKKLFCISVLYTIVASTSSVSVEESFSRYYAKNAPVSMEIPDGWVIETATDQYGVLMPETPMNYGMLLCPMNTLIKPILKLDFKLFRFVRG